MNNRLHHLSKWLLAFIAGIVLIGNVGELHAQNKVTLSIQNRRAVNNVTYWAEVWATVTSSNWQVGNSAINLSYNTSALTGLNVNPAMDADVTLSGGGYDPMQQQLLSGAVTSASILITYNSGAFTVKNAGTSFRIATLQWSIINASALDNIAFRTSGLDPTDLSDGASSMGFNCGANCFGVIQPVTRIIGEPVITQQPTPTSATVCAGLSTSFSVTATGNSLTYQWQKFNGAIFVNVTGQTASTLNFASLTVSDAGTYRVLVTSTVSTVTSNTVNLAINSPIAVVSNPASQTVCQGSPVSFTVSFSGTAPIAVQWQVFDGASTTDLSGQTSATLTIPNVGTGLNGNQYSARLTNVCGTLTSSAATLTVNTSPVVNLQPNSQSVCSGAAATFQANANGTPTPTVQWQVSTNAGVTFTNVASATSNTLTISNPILAQSGNQYRAVFTNTCGASTSSVAVLTVNVSPAITSNPSNQTVCEGAATSFTATATGTPAPTIQWQVSTNAGVSFTDIANGAGTPTYSGATSSTLIVSGITIVSNNNQYRAVFTNVCGTSTTTFATLTVNTAPIVTLQPQTQSVCAGNNAVFTATASGSPAPTIQWQVSTNAGVSFSDLPGQTGTTLTINNVVIGQSGNQYRAAFTNICSATNSNAATLTVNTAPVVTSNPSNLTICEGGSVSFVAVATGTPAPTVQWQVSTNAGVSFSDLPGATSITFTINPVSASQNGNQYRAVFTNVCGTSTSSTGTLIVNTAPVVTTGPQSQSICVGNNANFTVTFTGSPVPTVQWQVSTNAGATFTDLSGQTSATLTVSGVTTGQNGNQYRAVLTNVCATSTSGPATLTVNTAPVVTVNPGNQIVCSGNNATFTANATATPAATIQWQVSTNGGGTFNNLSGQTSATLTLTSVALGQNGNQYRAVFTNTCGSTATLAATLTVNAGPVVTTNPASQTVCASSNVTFSAAATGTPAPTVQWQVSTNGGGTFTDLSGQTSTTLTLTAVTAGQTNNQYRANFTNTCGTVSSLAATLTVNVAPVVTINPASQTICAGTNVAFTANATATPAATVQWQVSTNAGVSFTDMAGQTITTLSLTNVAAGQSGNQYRAVFTNSCGSSTTASATLTVNVAPVIVAGNPQNQTVCAGGSATFVSVGSGTPAPTIQWQVSTNGGVSFTDIPGATGTTFTVNNALASQNNNQYRAVYTNTCGSSTTVAATLTVNIAPVVTGNPSNQTVCAGGNATFNASAVGTPAPTIQWQVSTNGGVTFNPVPGATNTTFTFVAGQADNGNQYRAVFTNSCGTATTLSATLNFFALPAITQQPTAVAVCQGQSFSLTVGAIGTGLTYQWQKGGVNIIGANSATYTVASATPNDAGFYTVIVSNICNQPVVSNQVDVFVNNPAVITQQPISQDVCLGSFVQFSIQATGTGLSFQWQKNGVNIPGATNTFYTIPAAALSDAANAPGYTVVISGVCPGGISSNPATLTVRTAPSITSNPTSVVVCEGQGASFSVVASGSNLTYQWQLNGNNISGANSATYSIPAATVANAGTYTVTVSGSCPIPVTSQAATLTVNTKPRIVLDVADVAACQGKPATFAVSATGTNLTYQWQVNGFNIPGAVGNSYTIPVVTKDMAGTYGVVISGTCLPSVTSRAATLTVYDTVTITKQPVSKKVCLDGSVLLSVSAEGTGNPLLTYQWYRDGVAITGNSSAQTSQLILSNLQFTASGNYSVVVTGICGSLKSQDAILIVVAPPTAILKDPINKQAVAGDTVIFELSGISANTEGATFQWKKNGVNLIESNHFIGTQSSKLIITNVSTADESSQYSVEVHSTICNITVTSVLASLQLYTVTLNIVTQPNPDVVLCSGATLTLNGLATTTKVGGQITYQWYFLGEGSTQATLVPNGNNPTLTINNTSVGNAGTYYFVATETTSNPPIKLTSGNANVHVYTAPVITQQPQSITGCPGDLVSESVKVNVDAGPVTYQWFKDGVPLVIQGIPVTSASFSNLPLIPQAAGSYNVVVSGNCGTITSTTVTVTVKNPTVITQQPSPATLNVAVDGQINLNVVASGDGNCTYQWKRNGVAIPGATNPTYSKIAVAADDSAKFVVEITCDCGTITSNTVLVDVTNVGVTDPIAGERFDLGQNFPNPFDVETNIAYSLPVATNVRLVVTDTYGREVAVLVNGFVAAGSHTVKFNAMELQLPSGAYFYTMTASGYSTTRHMLLVK